MIALFKLMPFRQILTWTSSDSKVFVLLDIAELTRHINHNLPFYSKVYSHAVLCISLRTWATRMDTAILDGAKNQGTHGPLISLSIRREKIAFLQDQRDTTWNSYGLLISPSFSSSSSSASSSTSSPSSRCITPFPNSSSTEAPSAVLLDAACRSSH